MKNKIVKLTENDLQRIVSKVINESLETKTVSKVKGLVAALKANKAGEGRDVRQLIKAVTRLKSSAEQSNYVLQDIKNDLDSLFRERFMSKVEKFDDKLGSNSNLKVQIDEFKKELSEYKSLVQRLIEKNNEIKNMNLSSEDDE